MSTESTGKGDGMSGEAGDRMVAIAMAVCFGILTVLMIKGYV
jgi:hypothetical protein